MTKWMDDSISLPWSIECSDFLLPKCRWYLVLCCPCLFIQQPGIIQLIGFSGHFVFILKLFLFSLSCGLCRTLRSQRYTFMSAFSSLSFNCSEWWCWCRNYFLCKIAFLNTVITQFCMLVFLNNVGSNS